jgi:nitrite reductase (NADH) large subunit
LLASDLDKETLVRYIDRFLMYYVRTADRLERTATWLNKLPGGLAKGLRGRRRGQARDCGAARGRDGARSRDLRLRVAGALRNPEVRARFSPFLNTAEPDASVQFERSAASPSRYDGLQTRDVS